MLHEHYKGGNLITYCAREGGYFLHTCTASPYRFSLTTYVQGIKH